MTSGSDRRGDPDATTAVEGFPAVIIDDHSSHPDWRDGHRMTGPDIHTGSINTSTPDAEPVRIVIDLDLVTKAEIVRVQVIRGNQTPEEAA